MKKSGTDLKEIIKVFKKGFKKRADKEFFKELDAFFCALIKLILAFFGGRVEDGGQEKPSVSHAETDEVAPRFAFAFSPYVPVFAYRSLR